MCQYFCLLSIYKWGKDTFKCVNDTLVERVQGTIVYVSRTRLYMCQGHNHRTRLAGVTETHFNKTIVIYLTLLTHALAYSLALSVSLFSSDLYHRSH